VGRRVAAQRRYAGLTQAELAEKVSVQPETISRLETGAAMPSLARLEAVGQVLGLQLHDLLRVRPRDSPEEKALEKLVWLMSRRTTREIDLITDIAAKLFEHVRAVGTPARR
jgi:transcriptional regulator with XRE-family HTH domain